MKTYCIYQIIPIYFADCLNTPSFFVRLVAKAPLAFLTNWLLRSQFSHLVTRANVAKKVKQVKDQILTRLKHLFNLKLILLFE